MLAAYRVREFAKVIEICKSCKGALDGYLDTFYDVYIDRAEDLIKSPPPEDWDGVFIATSK